MKALEVYIPPFKAEAGIIFSSNNVMALMAYNVDYYPEKLIERTVAVLNGTSPAIKGADIGLNYGEIIVNGDPTLVVRGWGYLTGTGGLNLSDEEAARIQDEFAYWVVQKLRGEI